MSGSSLFEVTGQSVVRQAANWVAALLSGTLTTTIAVVIVGCLGVMLLSGRFQIRRAAQTIIGLFLLFGAVDTANALLGFTSSEPSNEHILISTPEVNPSADNSPPAVIDPYAGPSLPMPQ